MPASPTQFLLAIASLSAIAACLGVWLGAIPGFSRKLLPASGAILILVCFVWVLPDLAATFGWGRGLLLLLGTFTTVWVIDRYIYPICPACAHSHNHDACVTRLHGFAAPLLTAAALHSLFDGYALAAGLSEGLTYAVVAHKAPEALALGSLFRAALGSRTRAFAAAVAVQVTMLPGGALASETRSLQQLMPLLLAIGGGTFLYLGFHAVHGEWKRRVAAQAS